MVGNREIRRSARLWLLTLLAATGACTSVLGVEELHEGPREDGGSAGSSAGKSSSGGANSAGTDSAGTSPTAGTSESGGKGGSSSGGSAGTGGSAPADDTVHGKVVDLWGRALPNVLVRVGDQDGTTDTKGEFTFEDVPTEYDASLYVTIPDTADYGWVYQGVTRRDPTFQVYNGREEHETTVILKSANGPFPLAANDSVYYALGLADGVYATSSDATAGVQADPSWLGSTTTMGSAHALWWSFNAATQAPTKYSAYVTKLIALKDGTKGDPVDFDLAAQTLDTKAIEGTVTPVGQGDRANHLFARFDSHATIPLMDQDDAPDTFSYLVPTLPNASIMFAASEGDENTGPFAIAHADGLNPGDKNIKLSIPAPALPLQPKGENAPQAQTFKFQPGTGNPGPFLIWIERADRSGYAMAIVTAKTELPLPEVTGGTFTLDKGLDADSYYRWCVTTQGSYESVDDMTGPNGFLDVFGVRTGVPVGPKQTSGSYTSSAMYDFTRAE
jgi:hypothetical protein